MIYSSRHLKRLNYLALLSQCKHEKIGLSLGDYPLSRAGQLMHDIFDIDIDTSIFCEYFFAVKKDINEQEAEQLKQLKRRMLHDGSGKIWFTSTIKVPQRTLPHFPHERGKGLIGAFLKCRFPKSP